MTKTVSLNEFTYSKAAVLAGKLTIMAEKPVSLGMTIYIAVDLLDFMLTQPVFEKILKEKVLAHIVPSEDFDRYWDMIFKTITKEVSE